MPTINFGIHGKDFDVILDNFRQLVGTLSFAFCRSRVSSFNGVDGVAIGDAVKKDEEAST